MAKATSDKHVKVTLVRSLNGRAAKHQATVQALLGSRKMHHSRELPTNPAVMGMIKQVSYLLKVEEV